MGLRRRLPFLTSQGSFFREGALFFGVERERLFLGREKTERRDKKAEAILANKKDLFCFHTGLFKVN